jgi:hypothetical protein
MPAELLVRPNRDKRSVTARASRASAAAMRHWNYPTAQDARPAPSFGGTNTSIPDGARRSERKIMTKGDTMVRLPIEYFRAHRHVSKAIQRGDFPAATKWMEMFERMLRVAERENALVNPKPRKPVREIDPREVPGYRNPPAPPPAREG